MWDWGGVLVQYDTQVTQDVRSEVELVAMRVRVPIGKEIRLEIE